MEQRKVAWAIFEVAGRRLAFRADALMRVLPLPRLDAVRDGSFAVRGRMEHEGRPVPVLGGRRLLGVPPTPNLSSNRPFWAPEVHVPRELAVVLARRGRFLAVTVDRVVGVEPTPRDATVMELGELVHLGLQARFVAGVT